MPRHLRADHRTADEPRLHPSRWRRAGPARTAPTTKIRDWIKSRRARNWTASTSCCADSRSGCNRLKDVGWIGVEGCLALGVTGPLLRAAGLPWDLRKTEPYLGYETFDFEVPTDDRGDCWSRFVVRVAEMRESLKIVEQVLDRLEPGPDHGRRPEDRLAGQARRSARTAWATRSSTCRRSWTRSMESLIHHFKLVTEGFRVPPGQVYQAVESPRGELGAHIVSDGGTRPYRVHLREPSFINLQATAALSIGGLIADVIASVASIDPVMGGCDR